MTSWTFVHAADIHVGSPRSYRFRPGWNENWATARRQIVGLNPDLLLVGGDVARDGNIHDYELAQVRASLDAAGVPWRCVPGNMDTGNKHAEINSRTDRDDVALNVTDAQLDRFAQIMQPFPWTFVHKTVRFSGCYAAVAGTGLRHEQRLWQWLAELQKLPSTRHHVMLMHYALFVENIDEPNYSISDAEHYSDWYFGIDQPYRGRLFEQFKAARVDLVITGHIHCRRPTQTVDGVRFYYGASTAFPQWGDRWPDGDDTLGFYRFDVHSSGIDCSFVPVNPVSANVDGYGPGGHPKPEMRDYSLAWDQNRQ